MYDHGRTAGDSGERMPRRRAPGIVEVMSTATRATPPSPAGSRTDPARPAAPRPAAGARVIRMSLPTRVRKLLLLVHIAAAGVWVGLDLVLGILVGTALLGDPTGAGAAAATMAAVATWPLVAVGLLTLATGVLLGLGTKYGLIRYRWVLVKLVVNVVLVTLVVLVLWPGVTAVGEAGRAALVEGDAPTMPATLVFPPIVSSTALVVAMTLSVFKPWGRTRRRG